ncbi:Dimethylmenaquinone methyltransferase [Caldicellulosiruptor obsidiansis OB47]|mgnify:CR=1 FL=1|uniref:Putative 4-hydroxy-4-methyl-2-oxoglutarate aldolase n=1 Tax=Caldicellulosiruptor obsidiansis (strain ATCC BAA-2073 / JCM 16842 / OB47) TaxID=608506 RepID=D9THI3_CALOO|nr:dimethylmenaquinone methyltransferase [Caldicellulosiruptor obsidiansis]ADL41548.1 Dimethylmenaquinone methyltransferase [Caldicellulosiruptor obsidiansis OB47]
MFSQSENQELIEMFSQLRVADVRDGLDAILLHHYCSLPSTIRPLFRTKAVGIAKTVRYIPYRGEIPKLSPEEYSEWCGYYYQKICPYPWMSEIQKGDFIVIDQSEIDAGLMGSNNSLEGYAKGAVGYLTNGGPRDTDELIIQKIPFWSKFVSQKTVIGRLQFDAMNVPVNIEGVLIKPGDIIVADGDGVVVVPRERAAEVYEFAKKELDADKASRRKLYDMLEWEYDDTVK